MATVEAIFDATIQVLLRDGARGLTTTRVAERAGVSVGTMYQYFPQKHALLYALNERYLSALADRIEAACASQYGAPIEKMVEMLVTTYWRSKIEQRDVTRALYRSIAELDKEPLIATFAQRVETITAAMLSSAADVSFADLPTVVFMLLSMMFGTVRNVFERELDAAKEEIVYEQMVVMCVSYLETVRNEGIGL